MIEKKLLKRIDYPLIIIVTAITMISFAVIASATQGTSGTNENFYHMRMQMIWYFVGLVVMGITMLIDYRIFGRFYKVIYLANIVLLVIVLLYSNPIMGASRWIIIGPMQFQPSEFAKITLIISMAKFIEEKENSINDFKNILLFFVFLAIPVFLIIRQPDLGTSLVLFAIFFGMLFMGGLSYKFFVGAFLAGLSSLPIFWTLLKDYQKNRILAFINPNLDPLGAGYHVIQSKIAVGSGGVMGKGYFQGTQNQLDFLPEQHTDFIFSVLGEEFGLVGCSILLILYLALVLRGIHLASKSKDNYGMLIITGITIMFTFHILINIGMTIGIMPVTGLPLPFMSYGGSSLLTNMIAIGLILNIGMRRHKILF